MGFETPQEPIVNDSEKIDDPAKAEAMAHNSDPAHTTASVHRERGDSDMKEREKNAEEDEERAALRYDETKRAEAMTDSEVTSARDKYEHDRSEDERKLRIAIDTQNKSEEKDIGTRLYHNQTTGNALTHVMVERQKKGTWKI